MNNKISSLIKQTSSKINFQHKNLRKKNSLHSKINKLVYKVKLKMNRKIALNNNNNNYYLNSI